MSVIPTFHVGQLYSNDAISAALGVGNAGGIRPNLNTDGSIRRLVLLTALPTAKNAAENPYHDRVEGDVLIYTGQGLRGDQEPSGPNRPLTEQPEGRFPIWCFRQDFGRRDRAAGKDRWRFLGLLSLLRFHRERQIDVEGTIRSVWLFEFAIAAEPVSVSVADDVVLAREAFDRTRQDRQIDRSDIEPQQEAGDEVAVERVRGRLLALHPREFEVVVKRAFEATGYRDVAVTRYSQDGGIDVVASFGAAGWPVARFQVQVQAKRWLHTVGRKEVAELRGSLSHRGVGCLVTTSWFSRAARAEAAEEGKSPITLVNGREFAALLLSLGVSLDPERLPS